MLKQLVFALSYLNTASLLIPIGIGLYRRKAMTTALWMSWAALVAYLLLFLVSLSIARFGIAINSLIISYLIAGSFGGFFAIAYWLMLPAGWRKPLDRCAAPRPAKTSASRARPGFSGCGRQCAE